MRRLVATSLLLQGCFLFDGDAWEYKEPESLDFYDTAATDTWWPDLFAQTSPDPVEHQSQLWQYRSSAYVIPAGDVAPLSLHNTAMVGLNTMLCEVDWSTGYIGLDSDIDPDWPEEIADFSEAEILTTTPRGWQVFQPRTGEIRWQGTHGQPAGARLGHDLVVTTLHTAEGCTVAWGDAATAVVPEECPKQDGWALDPAGLTAWLGVASGVVEVPRDGTVQAWETKGDLLAWDAQRELLFIATRGGTTVSAWGRDRVTRWTTDLGAPIRQLRAVPARGAVAALVDRADGSAIAYLSADDGSARDVVSVRAHIDRFSLSVDATRLALAWGTQVDMFDEITP